MPLPALGAGASLKGCRPFASESPWNQDISSTAVDPRSKELVRFLALDAYSTDPTNVVGLKAEFSAGLWKGARVGLPYLVVREGQPKLPVLALAPYADESDHGPMPIPPTAPVEGAGSKVSGIDRHVIVVERDSSRPGGLGRLFELYRGELATVSHYGKDRKVWLCDNAAVWDLAGQGWGERPEGWTSADAAGLPIFPGLVRYDEVAAGEINHALRITVSHTAPYYVRPASHGTSVWTADNPPEQSVVNLFGVPAAETAMCLPPMGMRIRLRAGFDVSPFPKSVQVILRCLQRYGAIVADNGGQGFITGAPDARWKDDELARLREVKMLEFEVVTMERFQASSRSLDRL